MKLSETIIETYYWLRIFISPTAIFSIAGFTVYFYNKNPVGLIAFIALSALGIILGIYYAEKIRRKIGCSTYLDTYAWAAEMELENEDR